MSIPYHAWTHTPGGTDPIEFPGSVGQWCRLGMSEAFSVEPGRNAPIDWDVEANHDPDYFATTNALGGVNNNQIQILQHGVYAVTFGLYVDLDTCPTNSSLIVSFQNTTYSREEECFPFPLDPDVLGEMGSPLISGSKVVRHGPTDAEEEGAIYMAITISPTADSDLGFIANDLNITYFEIVRLGGIDGDWDSPYAAISGT